MPKSLDNATRALLRAAADAALAADPAVAIAETLRELLLADVVAVELEIANGSSRRCLAGAPASDGAAYEPVASVADVAVSTVSSTARPARSARRTGSPPGSTSSGSLEPRSGSPG